MTRDADEAEKLWSILRELDSKLDDLARREDDREVRDDRRDERMSSHEQRLIVLERSLDGVARREDVERLGELLESRMTAADLTGQVQTVTELAAIRDRVGQLEGAQSRANERQTARGAIGGVAASIILALVVILAKLLGVELPAP